MIAVGTTAVAANSGEHRASASEHRAGEGLQAVRPPVPSPVVDPPTPPAPKPMVLVSPPPAPPSKKPTTPSVAARGPAQVNVGTAGSFAVLTKTGITDVNASTITGNVGASPITGAAIALTCPEVKTGTIYSVNAAGPMPCRVTNAPVLTTAVSDEEAAYTDAAGRTNPGFVTWGLGKLVD